MKGQRDPAYKVMIAEWGPIETWRFACFWCEGPIVKWDGTESDSGMIHHADAVHENNALANLTPMHMSCHGAYHRSLEHDKYAAIARRVNAARTPEQLSAVAHKRIAKRSAADRTASGQRMNAVLNARLTHEQRVAAGHKASATRRARLAARA